MKTSEGGRTGAVELPDIMSLREPSSAVDFISGLQDKLLVKGSLVSCQRTEKKKKKKNRKEKKFHCLCLPCLPFFQEATLSHRRRRCSVCEGVSSLSSFDAAIFTGTKSILEGLLTFGATPGTVQRTESASVLVSKSFGTPALPAIS